MSRWLKSVNNLLETLDGQVETAVVDEHGVPTSRNVVDQVLSSRGLQSDRDDDDEESYDDQYSDDDDYEEDESGEEEWEEEDYYEEIEDQEEEETVDLEASTTAESKPLFSEDVTLVESEETGEPDEEALPKSFTEHEGVAVEAQVTETTQVVQEDAASESSNTGTASTSPSFEQSPATPVRSFDISDSEDPDAASQKSPASSSGNAGLRSTPASGQLSVASSTSVPQKPPTSGQLSISSARKDQLRRSNLERKKAQAEARQLRKHVIALNTQLESIESEMKAQREELQRAAERLERDRNRHTEEREDMMDEHDEELETQKEHYERLLSEQKERHEEQMEGLRERLEQTEERRMQEGGEWTTELEDAVQRERESLKKLGSVQDENSNLKGKVSKLESQQSALQNRLENAIQNAQTATNREREVEDKLDASLSLHSRQLSQKQAREAELERTVADLSAALVVARQKKSALVSRPSNQGAESFREQLLVAQEELETVKAQLALERQRSETLSQELQDVSTERSEEASAAQARQREHDRQVGDLTFTVSRLKASLRDMQRAEGAGMESGDIDESGHIVRLRKEAEESKKEVHSLSEQLMRQRQLAENSKREILTMKNRLRTATERADNAEKALTSSSINPNLYEMDASGALAPNRMRRRVKGGMRGRSGGGGGSSVKSIRSALNMEPGRVGEGAEQVAVTIDAIDSFMVTTGAMMRHEPLARAAFFMYLVILHVWTFCLVIFHAHSIEQEHGDFGSLNENGGVGGPDALVQHSYRHMEQMNGNP